MIGINGVAKIYYDRVKLEMMTIDEVPTRWRAKVEAQLEEDKKNDGVE